MSASSRRQSVKTSKSDIDPHSDTARILAVGALVEGKRIEEAANIAGVTRQTLWQWRTKDPDFQKLERDALEEVARTVIAMAVHRAVNDLRSLAPEAVKKLEDFLQYDGQLGMDAAKEVLRHISELNPKNHIDVNISGILEARLNELDARGDTESD